MGKKKSGVVLWSVLSAFTAILLVACIIGTNVAMSFEKVINIYFGTSNYRVEAGEGETVEFKSDYASEEELVDAEMLLCQQIEEEGAVLLKNNGALPLKEGAAVSLFSHSSVDLVYGGTGSGATDTSSAPTLKEAMEKSGFSVNQTLWDFYATGAGSEYVRSVPSWTNMEAIYDDNEVPWSVYTDDVKSSVAQYGDAAIVTLSRVGGEDYDVTVMDYETYEMGNYLELSPEEQEMLKNLKAMKDAGTLKNIIVLLNTANAVEVDFLFDDAYGVDAALWIGDIGQTGIYGVAEILAGNVNPSGRLVDTYCIDNTTSPAMVNFGDQYFANAAELNLYMSEDYTRSYSCITYQEGIYVGYRYYETRYEDVVMGTGNTAGYDYSADVAYPFGYGLSYTDFEWSNYSVVENEDTFEITLTVTNIGDVAGKDVVEIYFQSPYTEYDKENGIEKAAIELCGFAKTDVLEPNESQEITVVVEKEEFRTYDSNNAKTYILDAGNYYITAGENAHDALNNILDEKGYTTANGMDAEGNDEFVYTWVNEELDTTTYAVSDATENEITNQFDDVDVNKNEMIKETVTYLSRSDWNGTFPTEQAAITLTDEMLAYTDMHLTYEVEDIGAEMPLMGQDNGLSLTTFIGVDYDDESWDALLDQLTFDEMRYLVGVGYHATNALESVSKPETKDENGPQGLTALLTHGASAMTYTSEDVMAATWNVDLIEKVGKSIGEDCLNAGYSGLYGPGLNMHRTPYSGRNFEYYSEDPFISGVMAAAETKGIQSKGVYVYAKHFALNDQETNRWGACTFANEQTIREIYLEPFEKAIVDGGAWNVMSSLNFVGLTWSSAHEGLITNILRDEWGMRGIVITDYSEGSPYTDILTGLMAGSNLWDCSSDEWALILKDYENNPEVVQALRESAHRILYTVVNSNAMNGMSADSVIVAVTPWWKTAIYALDVAVGVMFIASVVMLIRRIMKRRAMKVTE